LDFTELTNYLDSLEARHGVPGCDMAVYHHGREVFRHSAGFSDAAKTKPVSPRDVYFVYSATKVFTTACVMQLIERCLLRLDDQVSQYLPEFAEMDVLVNTPDLSKFPFDLTGPTRKAHTPITIGMLMDMTAGLSYEIEAEPIRQLREKSHNQATTRETVGAIARMPLLAEPGTHYLYSLSHDVLAAVIEVVSGQSFYDYLKLNILSPLGVTEIWFDPNQVIDRISAQYECSFVTGLMREVPKNNRFMLSRRYQSGGAGILCTVDAYGAFASALSLNGQTSSGGRILKKETIDLWKANRVRGVAMQDFTRIGKIGYGYGLGVRTLVDAGRAKSPLGEFGWDGAAGAYTLIDTDNETAIFYAQHILAHMPVYTTIHPTLRDLTYEAMLGSV
jgi:CubicO group peptidase (beta-lactamase class C family)